MAATFLLETGLAIYTVYRYKMDVRGRLVLALIICLAAFQAAEYLVCTRSTMAYDASRFGYAAITMLPPLGLYLMSKLSRPLPSRFVWIMFGMAIGLAAYFLVSPNSFNGYQCTGNYVIFQIGMSQFYLYSAYYFGLIAASLWRGSYYLQTERRKKRRRPVQWFILGYLVFIIPVAVLVVVHPSTQAAVPSIMCGFAVGLAVILAAEVAPATLKKR